MLTIAIIGRPNVGKSTLFNRLSRKKLAIVDDTPGVTRDWRESEGSIAGEPVRLIDTAGLEEAFDDSIQGRMRRQTEGALEHADAVLFVVDGRSGITPTDEHFANWVRKLGKPVVLAVNKCESEAVADNALAEAWSLGLGEPLAMSAEHGLGLADLYQAFAPYFTETNQDPPPNPPPPAGEGSEAGGSFFSEDDIDALEGVEADAEPEPEEDTKPIKIAICGRPNVGKSTLVNAILEDERVMTGPEAGVTRDAIAVDWAYEGRKIKLVDTAGLRRKARVEEKIERMAVDDTMRAIRLAQVVILVIDGAVSVDKQDLAIARRITDEGRALVLAINKWDLVKDKKQILEDIDYRLERSLAQVRNIPKVPLSALKGTQIPLLMETVLETYAKWNKRISTGRLNRWISAAVQANPPPLTQGKPNKIRYVTQIKSRPPTFAVWVSRPDDIPDMYKRFLINGIRATFEIDGVPLRLLVRTSKNPYV